MNTGSASNPLPAVLGAAIGMDVQISLPNIIIGSFGNIPRGGVHWMFLCALPQES